mmetsp:Transcript_12219/g.15955  ORF Transcript_12219/g.15955 Transcript_12219/m.15955 type:complete len:303 (+) Transcript_12219:94-1002(+)
MSPRDASQTSRNLKSVDDNGNNNNNTLRTRHTNTKDENSSKYQSKSHGISTKQQQQQQQQEEEQSWMNGKEGTNNSNSNSTNLIPYDTSYQQQQQQYNNPMNGMYGNLYGLNPYGSFMGGGMGMNMGMNVLGGFVPGISNLMFHVQQTMFILNQLVSVVGMNADAMGRMGNVFKDVVVKVQLSIKSFVREMNKQLIENERMSKLETKKQRMRRKRLKVLRLSMSLVGGYLVYKVWRYLFCNRRQLDPRLLATYGLQNNHYYGGAPQSLYSNRGYTGGSSGYDYNSSMLGGAGYMNSQIGNIY